MSTANDEQERNALEPTNLIDVVAAETISEPETAEATVEIKTTVVEIEIETTEVTEQAAKIAVKVEKVKETILVTKTAVSLEDDEPVAPKPVKVQKPHKQQRLEPKSAVTSRDIKSWFATCGRCGFFLSAYQMIESAIDLETAVSHTNGRWLTLDWDYEIRNLVNKSYGCNPDTGIYHLDGVCPECRRRFIFHAGREKSTFRIALHPAIKR